MCWSVVIRKQTGKRTTYCRFIGRTRHQLIVYIFTSDSPPVEKKNVFTLCSWNFLSLNFVHDDISIKLLAYPCIMRFLALVESLGLQYNLGSLRKNFPTSTQLCSGSLAVIRPISRPWNSFAHFMSQSIDIWATLITPTLPSLALFLTPSLCLPPDSLELIHYIFYNVFI